MDGWYVKETGTDDDMWLDDLSFKPTVSIDSALTLVPEGWEWYEGFSRREMGDYIGQTHTLRRISDGLSVTGFHNLAYHAITIASLRAIEAMKGTHHE